MRKSKNKVDQVLLQESLQWIKKNPLATNLDVPPELLALWREDEAAVEKDKFPLTVFLAGYMLAKAASDPLKTQNEVSLTASEINEYYDLWQIKLALANLHLGTGMKSDPLPLFTFSEDETVRMTGIV